MLDILRISTLSQHLDQIKTHGISDVMYLPLSQLYGIHSGLR